MIAERRENPTDDLTSVLVHAEVEGEKLEEHEIVMGFFLLVAAGNDSTKATYTSGMRALLEDREQLQMVLDDPSLIPGVVEEALRMFPAFAHFRRTATKDTVLNGQEIKEGEKVVMWYTSSNRDETRYEDPDRFDVLRNPEHQAFGAGGRHFCLGTALARLELKILFEETLARYPEIEPRRQAALRRVGLPQPAEDAAGPARRLARAQSPSPPTPRSSQPRWWASSWRRVRSTWRASSAAVVAEVALERVAVDHDPVLVTFARDRRPRSTRRRRGARCRGRRRRPATFARAPPGIPRAAGRSRRRPASRTRRAPEIGHA